MRSRAVPLAAAAILAVAGVGAWTYARIVARPRVEPAGLVVFGVLRTDTPAPPIELPQLDGGRFSLAAARGEVVPLTAREVTSFSAESPRSSRPRNAHFTTSLLGSEAGRDRRRDERRGTVPYGLASGASHGVSPLLAVALGGFIGSERERHGREAGIRTHGAVALGACVFALISIHATTGSNPHVIAAGVVTGVGSLGAGVILWEGGSIVGLTTAATLWSTASVGVAVGYGMYILGMLGGVIVFGLLAVHHLPHWSRLKRKKDEPSARREENAASR